jgi:glucokinase
MSDYMIGVAAGSEIAVGLVKGHELVGAIRRYPDNADPDGDSLRSMPMEAIADTIAGMVRDLCAEHQVTPAVVGIGFPGIVRNGIIEEAPNLKHAKGARLGAMVTGALESLRFPLPVSIFNNADCTAAGLAATHGQLERLTRVWTLGQGVGFGRYPQAEGVWEGGHMVVSLDPKETYCGCGGRGHLEGIMGHRAMRLRFLDLEPDEIFANASAKEADQRDQRCVEFETLWHRALAAATANSIHMDGGGRFYLTGPGARYVRINLLSQYLHEMVTMTPLQGSVFEVVLTNDELSIIGAAVNAGLAAQPAAAAA